MQQNKRVGYMDIAKAIGIILVVIGHTDSPFTNFIYLFHMALFFFISGYFYKEEYSYNPRKLVIKRIKTLYLPFVLYELLFLALHNFFMKINIYSSKIVYQNTVINSYTATYFIKNIVKILTFGGTEQLTDTLWFLVALFIVNVVFCIISYSIFKLLNNKQEILRAVLICLCFLIGMLLSVKQKHLPRCIDISLVAILIYYLGYIYKTYEKRIKQNIFIFAICLGGLIIGSFYGSISMAANYYSNPIFFIVVTLFGIYSVVYISKYLDRLKLRLLRYIGSASLSIMALHFLCFKLINLIQIAVYNYPKYMLAKYPVIDSKNGWWVLYSIVGVLIPVLINYIYQKGKAFILNKSRRIRYGKPSTV